MKVKLAERERTAWRWRRLILGKAVAVGLFCALAAFLWTPRMIWWLHVPLSFSEFSFFFILPFAALYALFWQPRWKFLPKRLRPKGGTVMILFAVVYAVVAIAVWRGQVGCRERQDRWIQQDAQIVNSEDRVEAFRYKRLSVTRKCAKFQYAFEVDGRQYVGADYDCLSHRYSRWHLSDASAKTSSENPWRKGASVKVHFDPADPNRNVVCKTDVLPFKINAILAMIVSIPLLVMSPLWLRSSVLMALFRVIALMHMKLKRER